jgi:adenine-specific DNA methylase
MISTTPSTEKGRGAYFTPRRIADFLSTWAIRSPRDSVLDPACGEAVFLRAAVERLRGLNATIAEGQVKGIELDLPSALESTRLVPEAAVETENFFRKSPCPAYQAVVGNPPYIRYHYFSGEDRQVALARALDQGVALSQLTSSWAPFLIHATSFIGEEGRLAFVLPAELLATDYASNVRSFLQRRFGDVSIISFERRVFPGALVDAVLLLAEGRGPGRVSMYSLKDDSELDDFWLHKAKAVSSERWDQAFLEESSLSALAQASTTMDLFGSVARVDIGVVTGANDFFLLSEPDVQTLGLSEQDLIPTIARGTQLRTHILNLKEWRGRRDAGELVRMFRPTEAVGAAKSYIHLGEEREIHTSYKCRIRNPWWRLKIPKVPDLLLSYMSNRAPRLVANEAGVQTTNLLHHVRLHERTDSANRARLLSLSWPNSATLLSAEMVGRSYGGGVLKLETKEAERVLVPRLTSKAEDGLLAIAAEVDRALDRGDFGAAADLVDPVLFGHLGTAALSALRAGWMSLGARRKSKNLGLQPPNARRRSSQGPDGTGEKHI